MADEKIKSVADAAEHGRRKGQQTRAELIEENAALKNKVHYLQGQCTYIDGQRRQFYEEREKFKTSRDAWVRRCEELTGQLADAERSRLVLQDLADDYLQHYYDLRDHPCENLWRYMKGLVGVES